MMDVYLGGRGNGEKIRVFVEEGEVDYGLIKVEVGKGGEFGGEFLGIWGKKKIGGIVDDCGGDGGEGVRVFECGGILLYVGEKRGVFLSDERGEGGGRLEWLLWEVGGVGGMVGENDDFNEGGGERIG